MRAANRTGLSIRALEEKTWTVEDIEAFQATRSMQTSQGATRAWLAHLRALESFIESNETSTLILEDDVDFDIAIRSQGLAVSSLLKEHYNRNPSFYPFDVGTTSPYGLRSWDIMWLGHCGGFSSFPPHLGRVDLPTETVLRYEDATRLPPTKLHIPQDFQDDGQRSIYLPEAHPAPICSFAYAVNKLTVRKLYGLVTAPGQNGAGFDNRINELCKNGLLRCLALQPELFHHHEFRHRKVSLVHETDSEVSRNQTEEEMESYTVNIKHSARCNSEEGWEEEWENGNDLKTCYDHDKHGWP